MSILKNKIYRKIMKKQIKVLIGWSGDNYCAGTGEADGVIIVTAVKFEKIKLEFESAFQFHIDADDKISNYEIQYELEVSAILHQLEGILTRAALSRVTGINEKQLGHYINGFKKPRNAKKQQIIEGIHSIGQKLIQVS